MTALAVDTNIITQIRPDLLSYAVADNVKIYKGSLVTVNAAGYAIPATDTASTVFAGIADSNVDNTTTGHTAGGKSVLLQRDRTALLLGSGFAQSSVGLGVYVLDSGTVALTGGVTNHVLVGYVCKYVSATQVWVVLNSPLAIA
jgi:hypothetical protein